MHCHYAIKAYVPGRGIEPLLSVLQTDAVTTLAIKGYVAETGVEPVHLSEEIMSLLT